MYCDNRNAEGVCDAKYWVEVDKELTELRKLPNPEAISKYVDHLHRDYSLLMKIYRKFQDILDGDLRTYGAVDLEDLVVID